MTHTPTAEQQAVYDAATNSTSNLIINALAGAAKTSTLVGLAERLPIRTLCLAFNKKIADEMRERLPSHCTSATLNSIGFRAWKQVIPRSRIDTDKMSDILKSLIPDLPPSERDAAFENFGELLRAASFAKACGYIPDRYRPPARAGTQFRPLMSDDDFQAHYEERLANWELDLIADMLCQSLAMAWDGILDFDDQLLMPTIFFAPFERYPLVMIDEAQDLSALNHAMLRKIVSSRLIAVGDPCQAIYGFRGAHKDSMTLLAHTFSMKEFHLSISFRCPISVVEAARWRAPHMKYPDWAIPGAVTTLGEWTIEELPEGAAILCRNNAPLFSLAMKLLLHGRYAQIVGNDIGKGLLKIMKKFGPTSLAQNEVLREINKWEEGRLAKAKNGGPVRDRAACMRVFANQGKNLGDAITYAEHIFNASGPLKLMTGHKSKGLEFDDVFILNPDLIRDDDQDQNLRYVMQTRAKSTLTYITTEGLVQ